MSLFFLSPSLPQASLRRCRHWHPPISIPSRPLWNMAKPKPRRQCDCSKCNGETVASSTWYNHNPGGRKTRYILPQDTIDVILRQPETNLFPQAWKRPLGEVDEVEAPISKRATGSSSVCTTLDHNICASSEQYLQKYAPRLFTPVQKMFTDVRRTQR